MSDIYIPGGVLAREDPPPVSKERAVRTSTNWKLISQQLRQHPGVWFKAAIGAHAHAQHPRIARAKTENWAPAGSFEATLRSIDGDWHLWIRFVGVPPTPPAVSRRPGRRPTRRS